MHAIDITDVTKTYGEVTALDGLSLTIDQGTVFGLLGTNGAGKSTLFKLIVGHIRPDTGTVTVAGRDVVAHGPAVRSKVGYLPENAGFPAELTGREVLEFLADMRGLTATGRIDDVLSTVGLSTAADRHVDGYSNGMTRRLGLATALLSRPSILLLDEPTAGLDPRGVASFHAVIERLARDDDLTVILTSHVLSEIEKLCDDVAILEDGHLRTAGPLTELKCQMSDTVSVAIRLTSSDAIEIALAVVRERGATLLSEREKSIVVDCQSHDFANLLEALTDQVEVDAVEVTEPELDRVFEHALKQPAEVEA